MGTLTQSRALRSLVRNNTAKLGFAIVVLNIIVASFAPFIAPYDPEVANLSEIVQPPSPRHLLGADELGRDILSRIAYGSRISLTLGIVSIGIALFGGVSLGGFGAYSGGWADLIIF
jgi:ABC-type dipeptide/oligopeptide/nickel transport system permease subunit